MELIKFEDFNKMYRFEKEAFIKNLIPPDRTPSLLNVLFLPDFSIFFIMVKGEVIKMVAEEHSEETATTIFLRFIEGNGDYELVSAVDHPEIVEAMTQIFETKESE
jgi:hypothetical protein